MNYWLKIKAILTQNSPTLKPREKLIFALSSGFFVFGFLLFFQPFGVNNYNSKETITAELLTGTLLMWGMTTLLIGLNEFFIFPVLKQYLDWNQLWQWTLWTLWWMGSGIFLFYNFIGGWHDFHWGSYLGFLRDVSILGLFPLVGLYLYLFLRDMRSRQQELTRGEDKDKLLVFTAENQKDHFSLPLHSLLLIEADDNYVFIHHLQGNRVVKTLLRKSLKSIQEEVRHPALLRCHRSFLINLSQVESIQGNRNKLLIFLTHIPEAVPVSRQYMDLVLDRLSQSPQID